MVKLVERYEVADGQTFSTKIEAQAHEVAVKVHKALDRCERPSDRVNASYFMDTRKVCQLLLENPHLLNDDDEIQQGFTGSE